MCAHVTRRVRACVRTSSIIHSDTIFRHVCTTLRHACTRAHTSEYRPKIRQVWERPDVTGCTGALHLRRTRQHCHQKLQHPCLLRPRVRHRPSNTTCARACAHMSLHKPICVRDKDDSHQWHERLLVTCEADPSPQARTSRRPHAHALQPGVWLQRPWAHSNLQMHGGRGRHPPRRREQRSM